MLFESPLFRRHIFTAMLLVAVAACSSDDDTPPPNPCGNAVLDTGEVCDGTLLGGKTCATAIPTKPDGTLRCSATCTFDTSGCAAPPGTGGTGTTGGAGGGGPGTGGMATGGTGTGGSGTSGAAGGGAAGEGGDPGAAGGN